MTTQDTAVSQLREWALLLADRGWHVFPLRVGSRKPALHGHKSCQGLGICAPAHQGWEQRATTDTATVDRCWSAGAFNIGLATGPSGLLVLDGDMPGQGKPELAEQDRALGTTGVEAIHALAEQAGEPLPETYTVRTRRGGRHYYFRAPDGTGYRNTTKTLHPLIDTRAGGGYVVAPGSITPDGAYELVDDSDPAELPGWLAQGLAPKPCVADSAPREIAAVDLDRYTSAALRSECARLAATGTGAQNWALYTAALALGRLVAGGVLPDATVRAALHRTMSRLPLTRPHEPWLPYQIDATIDSAFRWTALRPRCPKNAVGEAA